MLQRQDVKLMHAVLKGIQESGTNVIVSRLYEPGFQVTGKLSIVNGLIFVSSASDLRRTSFSVHEVVSLVIMFTQSRDTFEGGVSIVLDSVRN